MRRFLLPIATVILIGCGVPTQAKICLNCGDTPPPESPEPRRSSVIVTQTVALDVMPIAVIYAPPGVCNGSADCPSQRLKSSSSFATSTTLTRTQGTGFSTTTSASATLSTGPLPGGPSASVSVAFSTSDNESTQTASKDQTVVVSATSFAASLRPTDLFTDLLPTGSKPGDRDVIAFMEYPVFDVSTIVGSVIPSSTPQGTLASFVKASSPATVSVRPNFTANIPLNCPAGAFCAPWTQRAVTVEQIRAQLAGGDGGIPELSRDALERLLQFDPITSGNPLAALEDGSGRFEKQPITYAWTPCDSQISPEIEKSTTTSTSFTKSSSFTSSINTSLSVEATLAFIPLSAKLSFSVGNSWTWGYSINQETTQIQGTHANAQFGGNGTDTGACGDPTFNTLYVDTVSGSILFDIFRSTPPPFELGNVAVCFDDAQGNPRSHAGVSISQADPAPAGPSQVFSARTNDQGCALLTLAAGTFVARLEGLPPGIEDRTFNVVASSGSTFTPLPAFRIGASGAGEPTSLEFSLQPPATVLEGDPLSLKAQVRVRDALGQPVAGYNGPVTLTLAPGTGAPNGRLTGRTTLNARAGVAEFSNIAVAPAAKGYRLAASIPRPALTATSAAFNVSPPLRIPVRGAAGSPLLTLLSVAGVPVPAPAGGSFDSPDVAFTSSGGNAARVRVAAQGLARAARVHLFRSVRFGETLLPPVEVGSMVPSNGVADFDITVPTTSTTGQPPVMLLQARATQLPTFTTAGGLRSTRAMSAGSFLASSSPVTVQASPTIAPTGRTLSIVDVQGVAPAATGSGEIATILLPPGTSSRSIPVVVVAGPDIADGTPVVLFDQSDRVAAQGTLSDGIARLLVSLPAPPATGFLPVTTLRAGVAGESPAAATGAVRVSIRRGFIGSIHATPFAGGLTISWETDPSSTGDIVLTDPDGQTIALQDPLEQTIHRVTVPDLRPSTEYRIRITATHPTLDPWSSEATGVSGPRPGDINGDAAFSVADAVSALRIIVGLDVATEEQLQAGDVDEIGTIRVTDVISILRALVGL